MVSNILKQMLFHCKYLNKYLSNIFQPESLLYISVIFFYLFVFSYIRLAPRSFLLDQQYNQQFVCVEVLRPSQPNGIMLSAVSLPDHMFTGQA